MKKATIVKFAPLVAAISFASFASCKQGENKKEEKPAVEETVAVKSVRTWNGIKAILDNNSEAAQQLIKNDRYVFSDTLDKNDMIYLRFSDSTSRFDVFSDPQITETDFYQIRLDSGKVDAVTLWYHATPGKEFAANQTQQFEALLTEIAKDGFTEIKDQDGLGKDEEEEMLGFKKENYVIYVTKGLKSGTHRIEFYLDK